MFQTGINEWLGTASSRGVDGTRPTTTDGTSVTPGASNTWGAYASLGVLSATFDVLELELVVHSVSVAAAARMVALDVAVDGVNIINDLHPGAPGVISGGGFENRFVFPVRIPAGGSLSVRAASLDATVTAIRVIAIGRFQPTRPDLVWYGSFVQTFGVGASGVVAGTAIVPGTVAEGAWVEIGTLTRPLSYFDFGYTINDTTMGGNQIDVDIALGDATNKRIIIANAMIGTNASEQLFRRGAPGRYARGAIGDKIYARAQLSGAADDNNSIAVYGVG